jgi:predicted transcriptional regulator
MEEGFILSNKFRRAIFTEVVAGERDIGRISKKHRIPLSIAEKTIKELIEVGVIKEENNRYTLTREGEKAAYKIKSQEL